MTGSGDRGVGLLFAAITKPKTTDQGFRTVSGPARNRALWTRLAFQRAGRSWSSRTCPCPGWPPGRSLYRFF